MSTYKNKVILIKYLQIYFKYEYKKTMNGAEIKICTNTWVWYLKKIY